MVADQNREMGGIKDYTKLNFSKVIEFILNGASENDIQDMLHS